MALLAAAQLWLCMQVVPRLSPGAIYDETLFLRLAQSLARGEWLGAYDQLTLTKGVGFPLWLAAVHQLGLPLMAAAGLTQALACAVLYRALKPLLASRTLRLAVFGVLLLCPTALSEFSLMRELIYPALTLLVLACMGGWLLRVSDVGSWRWGLAAGLATAAFVLTREEYIWLLPLVLPLPLVLWRTWRAGADARRRALASCSVLALGTLAPLFVVAMLNHQHYGVFTLLELNSRPFTSAYGALARIRHGGAPPQAPVPRENWRLAASVSASFAEAERHLSGTLGTTALGPGVGAVGPLLAVNAALRAWLGQMLDYPLPEVYEGNTATPWLRSQYAQDARFRQRFDRFVGSPAMAQAFLSGAMDDQLAAARFVWILRDSVAAAGHHRSATAAHAYYRRVADEINTACDQGRLACRSERHTLSPPIDREKRSLLPWGMAIAAQALLTLESHGTTARMGYLGSPAELAAASAFVHQRMANSHEQLAAVPAYDALIALWRSLLPFAAALACLGWLAAAPWPRRSVPPGHRLLWWSAAVLLMVVVLRLALLAAVHVSSWPAATLVRYLSPAHPPLVLFIALSLALSWQRWRR